MTDPRVIATREAFTDAFISLWEDQDYHSLTIRAVAEESGYAWATFYRHFKNLDGILMTVVTDLIAKLFARVGEEETRLAEMIALFRFIRDNERLFRAYLALPLSHPASQLLRDELMNFLEERYELRATATIPPDIALDFWIGSTLSVVHLYLNNIERFTAEQAAHLYIEMMLKTLGSTSMVLRDDWLQRHPGYLTED